MFTSKGVNVLHFEAVCGGGGGAGDNARWKDERREEKGRRGKEERAGKERIEKRSNVGK